MGDDCQNMDKLCAFWAGIGECKKNDYMIQNCGPSCMSCGEKDNTKTTEDDDNDDDKEDDDNDKEDDIIVNTKQVTDLSEHEALEEIKKYGEAQELDAGMDTLSTLDIILDSISYMRKIHDVGYDAADLKVIVNSCMNRNKLCAFWASKNECENNKEYMDEHCAPICKTCAARINVIKGTKE